MCRIAAYTGRPIALARLLYAPPHALDRQAYAPAEMISGTINVDGTGVVWWDGRDPTPLRYATTQPPWSDANLPNLAPRLSGSPILATVRSATPGIPGGVGAVLPFVHGQVAGTHNGYLRRFSEVTAAACLRALPDDLLGAVETLTDSAALFLLAVARLRQCDAMADADLAEAAASAVRQVVAICRDADAACSLNLVLARADCIVGVRCARGVEPNSLYARADTDGAFLASEPLDSSASWEAVPADHIVTLRGAEVRLRPGQFDSGESPA